MDVFLDRTFTHVLDRGSGATFSDMRFERCMFESCALSISLDPNVRTTVRNIEIVDCKQVGTDVRCAIAENCLVDGFNTQGQTLYFCATVFKQVTFRGKLGRLFFSPFPTFAAYENTNEINAAFATGNAEYYRTVDWAIDIRQAECQSMDLRGIPPRLVRRDPETQILISRERLAASDWFNVPFSEQELPLTLGYFLSSQSELEEMVFVAPKRSRRIKKIVQDIELLRKIEAIEPD
jgi:hypothetical protein